MQKHRKIRNVPFPRPCGATGNDAQKLHAPAFAHFRDAAFMHEVLSRKKALHFKGHHAVAHHLERRDHAEHAHVLAEAVHVDVGDEIGRASCRERV